MPMVNVCAGMFFEGAEPLPRLNCWWWSRSWASWRRCCCRRWLP